MQQGKSKTKSDFTLKNVKAKVDSGSILRKVNPKVDTGLHKKKPMDAENKRRTANLNKPTQRPDVTLIEKKTSPVTTTTSMSCNPTSLSPQKAEDEHHFSDSTKPEITNSNIEPENFLASSWKQIPADKDIYSTLGSPINRELLRVFNEGNIQFGEANELQDEKFAQSAIKADSFKFWRSRFKFKKQKRETLAVDLDLQSQSKISLDMKDSNIKNALSFESTLIENSSTNSIGSSETAKSSHLSSNAVPMNTVDKEQERMAPSLNSNHNIISVGTPSRIPKPILSSSSSRNESSSTQKKEQSNYANNILMDTEEAERKLSEIQARREEILKRQKLKQEKKSVTTIDKNQKPEVVNIPPAHKSTANQDKRITNSFSSDLFQDSSVLSKVIPIVQSDNQRYSLGGRQLRSSNLAMDPFQSSKSIKSSILPDVRRATLAGPANSSITSTSVASNSLLPHIALLTHVQLNKLTEANTRANGKYSRPIEIEVIQKEGPKPDSPNAKTLSRFAEMARRAENTKMADEIITKSKVRWLLNQNDHPTTLKSPCQTVIPRKSSIKVKTTRNHDWIVSNSPMIVKRILYSQ